MAKKSFKINKANVRIDFSMDMVEADELKKYLLEAMQVIKQDVESKARQLGSSGRYYTNWSGKLTRGSKVKILSYDKAKLYNNVKYAPYIHEGTGIYAKNGGGRRSPWKYYNANYGTWLWTKGIKPRPFLQDTLDQSEDKIGRILDDFIQDWWEEQ